MEAAAVALDLIPAAMPVEPGQPWPMGASVTGRGVNFAVFSAHASRIELCLYDDAGEREVARLLLPQRSHDVFHGVVPGAGPGLVYGLRAHGPWAPDVGHRFNPQKLLLDPYARSIVGRFDWADVHRAGTPGDPERPDPRDNGRSALKARVVADGASGFDWGDDRPPHVPLADTVIYELHVKGFSQRNPAVPPALRGSYAGLGHVASVAHLRGLGVTSLSLLPVHHCVDEERLAATSLCNYWGYNTIGFFSPDPRLACGAGGIGARDEFRAMVRSLHAAGIEVLLDVVFNHTAECDEAGPSISFRGLDNASYYRLEANDARRYENHAGCGNVLDIRRPQVLQLVLDSLRHWVEEMHVDGFRFDLATVLGRGDHGFDARGAFFTAVAQDPLLSRVKLIAEPWDIGPGGYQVGHFPRGWLEWNDRFRDDVRGFWLQGLHHRGTLARRLCASSDLFERGGRAPAASINYVVSHDGYTLRDLVSYERKHNLANGENNRDGTGNSLSVNCGVEGHSSDAAVNAARGRLQRVLLATTLLAQGTPMLSQGDELGHTQHGNNNPYCQDGPTTWIDWTAADAELIAFTAHVIALRRALLPFGDHWYSALRGSAGLVWIGGDGQALHHDAWHDEGHRAFGCLIGTPGRASGPLLLMINGSGVDVDFAMPAGHWTALLDTSSAFGRSSWAASDANSYALKAGSLVLLGSAASVAAGRPG